MVYQAEALNVDGFIAKGTDSQIYLKEAIEAIGSRRVYFSESFRRQRSERLQDSCSFDKVLTRRAWDFLGRIAARWNKNEIAAEMGIQPASVTKQMRSIAKALCIPLGELARYAAEKGFGMGVKRPPSQEEDKK